jgi:hypothetical protein
LEEIGDLYSKDEVTLPLAVDAFTQLTAFHPLHGEGWQKLADILGASDRSRAIECYKQAIELIEGDGIRSKIALTLQELLVSEGREEDLEPYRKYLTSTGGAEGLNNSFGN